eukprot:COSAG01_NODE_55747_length_323_cov_0.593750_1_plen_27_part_01
MHDAYHVYITSAYIHIKKQNFFDLLID